MYGQEMRWHLTGRKKKIVAFSDLHFCAEMADRRADYILRQLTRVCRRENIDYILFLGDLIDSLEVLENANLRRRLESFLKELAKFAPLIMVTGNHDVNYYADHRPIAGTDAKIWWSWTKELSRNARITVLDDADPVFDDGVVRILGLTLPRVCYATPTNGEIVVSAEVFREYVEKMLPQLMLVPEREYYLMVHTPQFLEEIELDTQIAVLAGHMHNGLVPPGVDGLTRFTDRGLVGPGYYTEKRLQEFIPLARAARYRPTAGRPWLTLNSCSHLPRDNWMWYFDWIFPAVSYAIIDGEEAARKFTVRYFT